MFARVTTAYFRKDLIDKATEILEESILKAAKQQEGFKSMVCMVDRESGKGYSITFWEGEDNIDANEKSQYYQEQLLKLMVTFTADPIKEKLEVVINS
jgi:heme-degrading monooxygenase HmoA